MTMGQISIRPMARLLEPVNLLISAVTTLIRPWAGWPGKPAVRQPEQTLVLYEFEGCPFCRIAREAVTALQIRVEVRPCPKNGTRHRPEVRRLGGKAQFPYLVDPNDGTALYESADIVRRLHGVYGGRPAPWTLFLGPLNAMTASLGLAVRLGSGVRNRKRQTEIAQPLEMWGAEGDPRARLLREVLCELELPHIRHPGRAPDGSAVALRDPNRGGAQAFFVSGSQAARHHVLESYP